MKDTQIVQYLLDNGTIRQDPTDPFEYYLGTTENIILQTTMQLIADNDQTTTLEVKEALRGNDRWAIQSEISEALEGFENMGILESANAGTHKIYHLPSTF